MPIAIKPDQVALQASIRDWAKQAGPLAAVRRLEPGGPAEPAAWTACLSEVAGLGVFSIAVPREAGCAAGPLTAGPLKATPQAGGSLRVTGQTVWTSLARQADWAIGLARTDPDVPNHQGLTYFLVDIHAPGIDIRPLREITGRAVFDEVFLDGVFVPDGCVLGAPGDGWRIAMSTLAADRVAIGTGQEEAVQRLLAAGVPDYAERTGLHVATAMSVALLGERGAHPAIRKLIGTGHRQAVAETVLELLGPDGAADSEASYEFLLTRCLSIAGGTTQILLNQVAERVLGLPR